jgi:hypothetical protein
MSNVDRALSLLTHGVRGQLGNRAYGRLTIIVNRQGRTSSGQQPYGGAANFFSTNEGRNDLVLYPQQSVQTVLHEMGHAYSLRRAPMASYASVLLDAEMRSFMTATGWRILTPPSRLQQTVDQTQIEYAYDGPPVWERLSHNDPLEDYANSFALYFLDPRALYDLSPARHEWFERNLP